MSHDVERWNLEARLLAAEDTDEAPAIDLGGVTVLAFLDGEQDPPCLAIQVILDDIEPELREAFDDELPLTIEVLGQQCESTVRIRLTPHAP